MTNIHTDELLRMLLQELRTQNSLSKDILKKLDDIDAAVMMVEGKIK